MSEIRSTWTSRLGFVLASAGAAIGLGAVWKFPYMAGTNGGSAFMFPYVVLSLTIGLALLIAEVGLGRTGGGCAVTTYRNIGGRRWTVWGYLGIVTGFLILSFYSTIGGWTLSYLIDAALGRGLVTDQKQLEALFGGLVTSPAKSLFFQALFLFITGWVAARDIRRGIEKLSKVLMPLLFGLVLVVIIRGVTLPGAFEGLTYLFAWNPEAFSFESLLSAMGFTFFSLCIGTGGMITYGSYLSRQDNLLSGCGWITILTTAASLLGGLMVMPAVFAFGLNPSAGPGLTFMTMPVVFAQLPLGTLFAVAFYACLVMAALTSSVALLEIPVAYLADERGMNRLKASVISSVAIFAVGSLCTLSFGPLADFKPLFGRTVFDLFDFFTSNLAMPIGGLASCALVGYVRWAQVREEIRLGSSVTHANLKLYRGVLTIGCPLLVITVLITGLI